MEVTLFHTVFLSLSLFIIFLTKLHKKKPNHHLNKVSRTLPPTLPSLPILGHLHLFTKPLHQTLADLSVRLGPIVSLRFGSRPVVSVSSPEIAEMCLTAHGPASIGPVFAAAAELLSSPFLHSAAARIRADEARRLLRGLFCEAEAAAAEWSSGGAVKVELKSRLFGMAVDVVMRMVAGKRYYGAAEEAAVEGRRFREAVEEMFGMSGASSAGELARWLRWVDMVDVGQRLPRFRERMDVLLQELIEVQRSGGNVGEEAGENINGEKSMIHLLQSLQLADPLKYNDAFNKDLVTRFIAAGTETVSNTIEWAMSLLLNNPEKMKKARAEIDDNIGHSRLLRESDLSNLSYLHCIISETLRLYPAAPVIVALESSSACMMDGYEVPSDTMLLVNVYSIHRNPEVWHEPEKFIPERFQSSRAEGSVVMPFGLGRRRCPGEAFADRVIGLVLGSMIQCFEWERVGNYEVDMMEGASLTLPKVVPLEAVCTPRPSLTHLLERL
ncbi:Isoflavone 2'-hydroxylase [Platanthera guangdongensis]|uniref:Isoflavone 2'-hydroxylase n=1 Tax=Platanthera guangdongensis TaxID=2320717 RepID=A0ABR2MWX3_9ASPA